jgi:hypothetical protein
MTGVIHHAAVPASRAALKPSRLATSTVNQHTSIHQASNLTMMAKQNVVVTQTTHHHLAQSQLQQRTALGDVTVSEIVLEACSFGLVK